MKKHKRSTFSGKLGFVLSAAGASVGLGNIWRFPYLAAKYGGGIFLLVYIILALTFGYTLIMAETSLGRMTRKSPVGAFESFGNSRFISIGGWINAIIPILIVLSLIIAVYSVTRPGAIEGVKYFLVPNFDHFSWMTVVSAMGQMFYSLSIAMGILITFGSYMKKDTSIEKSTENVEIFDTAIAIMAGLMIIPAVFAFSGGNAETLKSGPALMFITIPKVFANMGFGTAIGVVFFLLVLFAAVTSSIALTESAVSTFEDELHWSRKKSTVFMGMVMLLLGTLSCLGYGPLANFKILGMQFLDFFDFITNSVMMPIAAIATCLLVSKVVGVDKIEEEITKDGQAFRRKKIFCFMIKYLCPLFAAIILISSVANAFGIITM